MPEGRIKPKEYIWQCSITALKILRKISTSSQICNTIEEYRMYPFGWVGNSKKPENVNPIDQVTQALERKCINVERPDSTRIRFFVRYCKKNRPWEKAYGLAKWEEDKNIEKENWEFDTSSKELPSSKSFDIGGIN